jgi:elongation factor G
LVVEKDDNRIVVRAPSLDKKGRPLDSDAISLPGHLQFQEVLNAYVNGASAALGRGPGFSFQLSNVELELTLSPEQDLFGTETTTAALSAAARLASIAAFHDSEVRGRSAILEPVMDVDISVDDASLGGVVQDITSRMGGTVVSLGDGAEDDDADRSRVDVQKIYAPKDPFEAGNASSGAEQTGINMQRVVKAKVPLKEMVGYLKHLRSMTGGRGTFVMSVDRFERVTGQREKVLIAELKGEQ